MPSVKGKAASAQDHPDDLIAGRFKLLKKVGSGGMGDVWSATDITTNERFALKVIHPDRRTDDHSAERFQHEASVGALLAHPNVTHVHELLELEDGTLVLVMELLVGESLRKYLRLKGPLSSTEVVALMLPVLSALHHAHGHGVVHRDIKPANIFLHVDASGLVTPKLLDFGIAKSEDSSVLTRTGDALGTPSYMSPEQVRALPLDGRSDLFAVGVLLFESIAGQNPFAAPAPSAVLAHVLELEVDPDPKIDPRVWLEISRAISKQPYARHASADELSKALVSAVGETPAALGRFLRRHTPEPETIEEKEEETNPSTTQKIEPEVVRSGMRSVTAVMAPMKSNAPLPPLDDPRTDRFEPTSVMSPPVFVGSVSVRPAVLAAIIAGGVCVVVVLLYLVLRHHASDATALLPDASELATPPPEDSTQPAEAIELASPTADEPRPHTKPPRKPPPPAPPPPKPRAPDAKGVGRTPGF
jgi:serine/threonine-protein kinase